MSTKLTKNRKKVIALREPSKLYSLEEAIKLVKQMSFTKFDASVDVAIRLGVDPRKSNQMVRGTVILPHGTGKTKRVLALVTAEKEQEAKEAGADYIGLDEYIQKISEGWLEFDAVVANPPAMPKIGKVAKILGPRGLMPNPKTGTVTDSIKEAITEIKKGKVSFKVDKYGIIHCTVGKVSFTDQQLFENIMELYDTILKLKPAAAKGAYILSFYISSTMSPSVQIDHKSIKR